MHACHPFHGCHDHIYIFVGTRSPSQITSWCYELSRAAIRRAMC